MRQIGIIIIMVLIFLYYLKFRNRTDGEVLLARAEQKIDAGDITAAKMLLHKAGSYQVNREKFVELERKINILISERNK
ncbi:hypothetical protein MWH25_11660 [Natroniella acetigena]|uniref:hypothetical protein n=1 Tax=Natroniella acetigena TaxID=52004 RepID=UPI00200B6493|nr:hypothetical protein [Natroniella acetigena]MCK8828382.1 hypothetical protein [Natroniella acetigena]